MARTKPSTPCVIYWLYDETCFDPRQHGYIGYSGTLKARIAAHRKGGPKGSAHLPHLDFKVQILFRGTYTECLIIEEMLRPHTGIGWNRSRGGARSCLGFKHSPATRKNMSIVAKESGHSKRPKSTEWKAAISAATTARYADPSEHAKTIAAVKKAFKGIDRSGANNAMFGHQQSAETKAKIGAKARERGLSGKNNPNYRHGRYC
jgi:hypothetical protein